MAYHVRLRCRNAAGSIRTTRKQDISIGWGSIKHWCPQSSNMLCWKARLAHPTMTKMQSLKSPTRSYGIKASLPWGKLWLALFLPYTVTPHVCRKTGYASPVLGDITGSGLMDVSRHQEGSVLLVGGPRWEGMLQAAKLCANTRMEEAHRLQGVNHSTLFCTLCFYTVSREDLSDVWQSW